VGGLDKDKIVQETQRLLEDQTLYKKMSKTANLYAVEKQQRGL